MRRGLLLAAVGFGGALLAGYTHEPHGAEADPPAAEQSPADDFIDPLGPNSACYVCHMTFVREEISKVHLAEQIGCIKCHGLSAAHANDENVGATPPDITFKRRQVDRSCGECHENHDVPAGEVVARFLQRKLPPDVVPVCTNCHGTHRIERAAEEPPKNKLGISIGANAACRARSNNH